MKRKIFFSLFVIILIGVFTFTGCNREPVLEGPPRVMNSTLMFSGHLTGTIYPEVRTASMRATGQARNFLLVEAYGIETCYNTRSIAVEDSLSGNQLYLSIIDEGPYSPKRCYRNTQFWVGPFTEGQNYILHLSEATSAFYRDTLSLSFKYDQHLNMLVRSDSCAFLLSEKPFENVITKSFDESDIPDFHTNPYYWENRRTIHFFETDTGLFIQTILSSTCGLGHAASYYIGGDTLFMMAELDPPDMTCCDEFYFYHYLIKDYDQQIFYYKFILNNQNWASFEGFYNLP